MTLPSHIPVSSNAIATTAAATPLSPPVAPETQRVDEERARLKALGAGILKDPGKKVTYGQDAMCLFRKAWNCRLDSVRSRSELDSIRQVIREDGGSYFLNIMGAQLDNVSERLHWHELAAIEDTNTRDTRRRAEAVRQQVALIPSQENEQEEVHARNKLRYRAAHEARLKDIEDDYNSLTKQVELDNKAFKKSLSDEISQREAAVHDDGSSKAAAESSSRLVSTVNNSRSRSTQTSTRANASGTTKRACDLVDKLRAVPSWDLAIKSGLQITPHEGMVRAALGRHASSSEVVACMSALSQAHTERVMWNSIRLKLSKQLAAQQLAVIAEDEEQ